MPDNCFCEAIRDQLVRQPANSVSGLAFVAVGLLVIMSRDRSASARGESASVNHGMQAYAILFGIAAILVGLGTVFYHASLTFLGQTADVFGMYLIATLILLYGLGRLIRLPYRVAVASYLVGNIVLLAGLIVYPELRRYAFAVLILGAIGLEITAIRRGEVLVQYRWFVAAVTVLAIGFCIWIADVTRAVCAPNSWIQGHAIWHIAGAAATWLVFRYYQTTLSNA